MVKTKRIDTDPCGSLTASCAPGFGRVCGLQVGERVIVSAAVTGDGEQHRGWIADIYEFLHETFVEVKFDKPALDGRLGCVLNNLGLIEKE